MAQGTGRAIHQTTAQTKVARATWLVIGEPRGTQTKGKRTADNLEEGG